MKKNKLYYLKKALEMAQKDRDLLIKKWNEYYPTLEVGGDNSAKFKRREELEKQGYDPMEYSTELVTASFAISDLNNLIYFEERK